VPEPSEEAKKFASHFAVQPSASVAVAVAVATVEEPQAVQVNSDGKRIRYIKKKQKVTKTFVDEDGFEGTD